MKILFLFRPLFSLHHTFTLAIIMMVLKSLVIVITIEILGPKQYEPLPVNMTLFGCVFVLRLLTNFTLMVISNSVSTWHWTKDKLEIPPKTLFQSIRIVLRYKQFLQLIFDFENKNYGSQKVALKKTLALTLF